MSGPRGCRAPQPRHLRTGGSDGDFQRTRTGKPPDGLHPFPSRGEPPARCSPTWPSRQQEGERRGAAAQRDPRRGCTARPPPPCGHGPRRPGAEVTRAGGMEPAVPARTHSQDAGAGGAHEAAHGHVGVGGAPLVAVEALAVGREAAHLPQQLQVLLLLLPLGARGHGPAGEGRPGTAPGPAHTPAAAALRGSAGGRGAGRAGGWGEDRGGRGGEGTTGACRRAGAEARWPLTRTGSPEKEGVDGGRGSGEAAAAAAAPGPGRRNDEPGRNLRDTFMSSARRWRRRRSPARPPAAAPPVGGEDAPHPLPPLAPRPQPGAAPPAGPSHPAWPEGRAERAGGQCCGESPWKMSIRRECSYSFLGEGRMRGVLGAGCSPHTTGRAPGSPRRPTAPRGQRAQAGWREREALRGRVPTCLVPAPALPVPLCVPKVGQCSPERGESGGAAGPGFAPARSPAAGPGGGGDPGDGLGAQLLGILRADCRRQRSCGENTFLGTEVRNARFSFRNLVPGW